MKNLVNSTKTYVRKIERVYKNEDLISEIETESYTESKSSENIHSTELQNNSKKYRFFPKLLGLILKLEGVISFCLYFKEPVIINVITFTAIKVMKIINV